MIALQKSAPIRPVQLSVSNFHGATTSGRREALMDVGVAVDSRNQRAGLKSVTDLRQETSNPERPTTADRLAVTLDYMKTHLNQPVKVAMLSAMAGLSVSRFSELFRNATGDTPLNWFIRARMRWASELLETSDLQVKEVAWRVGYEDQFYFSRLFRSVHGISPSEYRARHELMGMDGHKLRGS